MKKILIPIIITIIQIISLWLIHSVLYANFPMHHKSIGFGLTIIFTGRILLVVLFLYNYYLEYFNKFIYPVGILLLIVSSLPAIQDYDYRPYRSLLLILLSFIAIISSILIKKIRNRKKS